MKSKFEKMAEEIGKLVTEKNLAYGDSFAQSGKIMEVLYPDGIRPDQYQDALAVVRIIDKLFRIATRKDAFGESPFRDIAGYGLLGAVRHDEEARGLGDEADAEGEPGVFALSRLQAIAASGGAAGEDEPF